MIPNTNPTLEKIHVKKQSNKKNYNCLTMRPHSLVISKQYLFYLSTYNRLKNSKNNELSLDFAANMASTMMHGPCILH